MRNLSLFEADRLTLDGALELSIASLRAYGERYRHWALTYSGGKDSTATVAFVTWAIRTGAVPAPESLPAGHLLPRFHRGTIYRQAGAVPMNIDGQGNSTAGSSGKVGWCWPLPEPDWTWNELTDIKPRTLRMF